MTWSSRCVRRGREISATDGQTYEKGNISRYLSLVTIGQTVKIKGPKGKFVYKCVAHLTLFT